MCEFDGVPDGSDGIMLMDGLGFKTTGVNQG